MVYNYINLTNGIEAIPTIPLNEGYRFIRIQSTLCEQKNWDRIIQELDYDFLMNLALGNKCVVYDFGARKYIPRAIYQGLLFIKYVLYKRWIGVDYKAILKRSDNKEGINCTRYFEQCYNKLDDRTLRKLDYFKPFLMTEDIKLNYCSSATIHDGDKEFYRNILIKRRQ